MNLQITDLPPDALNALAFLRGHLSGVIRFDEEFIDIKIVIAPDGRLIAPVMVAMLRGFNCALFLPREPKNEEDPAIQLQVDLVEFKEEGPDGVFADRWRIYHGQPPDVNWAFLDIDAARLMGNFISSEPLHLPNTFAEFEPALCRDFNSSESNGLRRLASASIGHELDEATLVGVDELGFDIRGRFDVVRIEVPEPMLFPEVARAKLTALLEEHS